MRKSKTGWYDASPLGVRAGGNKEYVRRDDRGARIVARKVANKDHTRVWLLYEGDTQVWSGPSRRDAIAEYDRRKYSR